ncbi:hypothetical protein AGRA3207_006324 [Actinomadura graeca]|uniref:Chromosome partition protein Smc n=1 Tax=Actinomadura graeca TaxID=2750812 RepID=A0ABX8R5B1_9ACTN|nr:hypothetical protein [Actinomadura graeca]QXJ24912.1 hypothetical protein AGRA3207_006324 [Actinomadura graeca]
MTTVVLVVMCLAVGALELYAGRRSRDQAEAFTRRIEELNEQVTKQNSVLVTVGEQLTAELSRVKQDVLPALDTRLRHNTGQVEELAGIVHNADEYLRTQSSRLHDLEQQRITLAALRRKLTEVETSVRAAAGIDATAVEGRVETVEGQVGSVEGKVETVEGKVDTALGRLADLEKGGSEILELQRSLARTLEGLEDVVAELLRFTEGELDGTVAAALTASPPPRPGGLSVTATGRLWTRDDQLQDILADMYERCVRANRLDIRFRTSEGADGPAPGSAGRLRYFLGGQPVEDLAGAFSALLISTGADLPHNGNGRRGLARVEAGRPSGVEPPRPPEDEAALKALLRTLFESTGAVAQIGPLMAVRTREELLCAVLTSGQSLELENDEVFWDPATATVRLRRLPSHQLWDLTAWASTP